LTTDPAGYADHAEISYANEAITTTKPVATPGLVLAGTNVTPIISSFGKNLISTYKNLCIRGGYGATTTAASDTVHITVDQAILTDVNGNGILVSNGTYDIHVGVDGGDVDTTNRSWDVYAVWLLRRDAGEVVARLSKSHSLSTVIGNLVVSDASHTYTHGLLIGHVYMYNTSTFFIQPSIQYGNTMRFLFKNPTNTTVSYGASYINAVDVNAFAQYFSNTSGVNPVALAGIPSTVGAVEIVATPVQSALKPHFWINSVLFDAVDATSGTALTSFDGRYGIAEVDSTHQYTVHGWVSLVVPNTVYVQGPSLSFTVGGWQENI
jgi:hypothetical protein